jgi:hypothetical protein
MTTYENQPAFPQKPSLVQAIAIMTLVNGILNILWGGGAALGLTIGIVTICLVPFALLPIALGIFEIIYAVKLLANPPQPVQPSQAIAIMEICCILFANVISLVVGILALVFYNDVTVKAYFAKLNGYPAPVVAPVEPALQAEPVEPEKPKRTRTKKASE